MDTVSIVITAAVGLFALIGFFIGLSQGFFRQVIRTVTLAAAAVASVFISKAFYGMIANFFDTRSIEEIYAWITGLKFFPAGLDISWMLNVDSQTAKSIIAIPLVLVAIPLIFATLFVILSLILKIVHVILCAIFGLSKKKKNFITSLLGGVLGAACAVIVFGLVFIPFLGLINVSGEAVTRLNEEMPDADATAQINGIYENYLEPVNTNPIVTTLGSCGVNGLYKNLVTVDHNGEKTDISTLLPDIALIYANKDGFENFQWQTLTPENKAAINNVTDIIEENPYLTEVLANVVRSVATSYNDGRLALPIPAPYDTVAYNLADILEGTNVTNLNGDIDTIVAVYYILSDYQVLAAFTEDSDAMLNALTAKDESGITPVTKVIDEIKKNERTKPLITVITKLSVSVMSNNLGLSEENTQVYEEVKAGLTETLKINRSDYAEGEEGEAEYKAAVSSSIDTTLKDNGITLEPEIVDSMADYVAENFADKEEVTDEDVDDLILSYYDAYLEYQETGKVPDDIPLPDLE